MSLQDQRKHNPLASSNFIDRAGKQKLGESSLMNFGVDPNPGEWEAGASIQSYILQRAKPN